MRRKDLLLTYFVCVNLPILLSEITDMHNPESVELIRSLETAFCSINQDYATCNEVEGRICLNKQCVNACTLKGLKRCICNNFQDACTLCCGSATSVCLSADRYGIYRSSGEKWVRHSEKENCAIDRTVLCPPTHEGKVCAVLTIKAVEYPRICRQRNCESPTCTHLTSNGASIVDCDCPEEFSKYPSCCKSEYDQEVAVSTKNKGSKCMPFQFWLRSESLRILYVERISALNGYSLGTNELETAGAWQVCGAESNDQRCGLAHKCQNNVCKHVCENPAFECYCAPGSSQECHLCCLVNGECTSILQIDHELSSTWEDLNFYQKVGRPCNFTLGTCDSAGKCRKVSQHPTLSCSDDRDCGFETICQNGRCSHLCGSADKRCICSPQSNHECHVCCLTGSDTNAKCESVGESKMSTLLTRPTGTPCNYSYGFCSSQGTCVSSANRPRQFCPINDVPCGQHRMCKNNNCEHICGEEASQCICSVSSLGECHLCCKRGDICQSVYDGKVPSLLREYGTPCNFTFGTCDNYGSCRPVKDHPSYGFCNDQQNEGKQCGEKHQCVERECRHVCDRTSAECQCSSISGKECHVCCQRGSICDSVYDGRNAKQTFLLKPTGSGCNFTFGYCDGFGNCQPVTEHPSFSKCRDPTNEGESCGDNQVCKNGQCSSVCGSPTLHCQCRPNTKNECHLCCLDNESNECHSVFDGKNTNLLKPSGTSCNFTFGLCSADGICEKVEHHPYESSICAIPENNLKPCGPKRICDGSQCVHVCGGSELNECICDPDSQDECHICCSIQGEACQSVFRVHPTNYFLRPIGSSCGHSTGVCDREGTCMPSDKYCRLSENLNKQCASASYCNQRGQCQHACSVPENLCICPAGSAEECQICCYNHTAFSSDLLIYNNSKIDDKFVSLTVQHNETAVCSSAFRDDRTFLVRTPGSSCNYTLGVCFSNGVCGEVEHHPFARKYTDQYGDRPELNVVTLVVILAIGGCLYWGQLK